MIKKSYNRFSVQKFYTGKLKHYFKYFQEIKALPEAIEWLHLLGGLRRKQFSLEHLAVEVAVDLALKWRPDRPCPPNHKGAVLLTRRRRVYTTSNQVKYRLFQVF